MKKFFWVIIAVIAFSGCCNNDEDNLAKMLFLLNRGDGFREYTFYPQRDVHCNFDSILAELDTNMLKNDSRRIIRFDESWLDSICTEDQLIQLVNDKRSNKPSARLTAYAALISRGYKGVEKMVLDNYKDTTTLSVWQSDFGWSERVGSIFLRYANIARKKGSLSARDSVRNDSLALFTPGLPVYESLLLQVKKMQPKDERHYKRIRELYLKEPHEELLMAMARYHKTEDQKFIASELLNFTHNGSFYPHMESAASAITVWPHPYFKQGLTELRDSIIAGKITDELIGTSFMEAVMAYDEAWVRSFLETSFKLDAKAPKRKYQLTLVDAFHEVMICDEEHPYLKDLLKKYPSKRFTNN